MYVLVLTECTSTASTRVVFPGLPEPEYSGNAGLDEKREMYVHANF